MTLRHQDFAPILTKRGSFVTMRSGVVENCACYSTRDGWNGPLYSPRYLLKFYSSLVTVSSLGERPTKVQSRQRMIEAGPLALLLQATQF